MAYIVDPLANNVIPVSRNADRAFTVQRVTAEQQPQNYDAGSTVTMYLDIDKAAPTTITATVSGPNAAIVIPSSVADRCKTGTTWQVVLNHNTKTPLLVGTIVRNDGR